MYKKYIVYFSNSLLLGKLIGPSRSTVAPSVVNNAYANNFDINKIIVPSDLQAGIRIVLTQISLCFVVPNESLYCYE